MNQKQPLQQMKKVTFWGIFCWCFFDWAQSAFPTVIITFIFGTYFIKSVAPSEIIGTAYWGWTMGLSGLLVAIFSPIFGSIADYTKKRKPFLGAFTLANALCTALLFYTEPSIHWVYWALIFVVLANFFYELTQVFYNSMMVSIAPKEKLGRISGWGWGLGYVGGLVCLVLALFLFIENPAMPTAFSLNIRSTTLLVAAWFLIFSIPLFIFTPDEIGEKISLKASCQKGLQELWQTLKNIKQYKGIFLFLIAHLIYIDGLNTLLPLPQSLLRGLLG